MLELDLISLITLKNKMKKFRFLMIALTIVGKMSFSQNKSSLCLDSIEKLKVYNYNEIELRSVKDVYSLKVYLNNVTELPKELKEFKNILKLDISILNDSSGFDYNQIAKLSRKFKKIQIIRLYTNREVYLNKYLKNWSSLKKLSLYTSERISIDTFDFKNLEELYIFHYQFHYPKKRYNFYHTKKLNFDAFINIKADKLKVLEIFPFIMTKIDRFCNVEELPFNGIDEAIENLKGMTLQGKRIENEIDALEYLIKNGCFVGKTPVHTKNGKITIKNLIQRSK